METNCGCKIDLERAFITDPLIKFCPLHVSAEKMLTTLNRFIIYHTQQVGQLTHILEAAERITAKAEA